MLTAYIRSVIHDSSTVDDLFQETMMIAWSKFDDCDLSRPFGPWIRGIASRLMSAHLRKSRKSIPLVSQAFLEEISAQLDQIQGGPGDTWQEKIAQLGRCVQRLSALNRTAVETRYLHGESMASTCQRLNISLETIKKRLQRARRQLADCLTRHNVLSKMMP